ncbi:hypothetical protein TNCV_4379491 [Trichonephila clavipes]|nr:hypothetical protein TNCV_4379491 [Trichonephila clavipes]
MLEQGQTFRISAKEYSLVADVDISVAYKQLKRRESGSKASKLRFTYSVSKDSEAEDEFSDEAVEAVTKEEVKLSRPHSKRDINEISEPDTQIPPGFRG